MKNYLPFAMRSEAQSKNCPNVVVIFWGSGVCWSNVSSKTEIRSSIVNSPHGEEFLPSSNMFYVFDLGKTWFAKSSQIFTVLTCFYIHNHIYVTLITNVREASVYQIGWLFQRLKTASDPLKWIFEACEIVNVHGKNWKLLFGGVLQVVPNTCSN